MSIQILQYEFLGPVPLDDWGPPMEKLIYLVMSRDGDKFSIVYVGNCEKTDEKSFFVQHPQYKCWIEQSGTEKSLHLAILPLSESSAERRGSIFQKIVAHYKPLCNSADITESKPDYVVRRSGDVDQASEKFPCPCCGSEMKLEKVLEKSSLFRCTGCGSSDTRINS